MIRLTMSDRFMRSKVRRCPGVPFPHTFDGKNCPVCFRKPDLMTRLRGFFKRLLP